MQHSENSQNSVSAGSPCSAFYGGRHFRKALFQVQRESETLEAHMTHKLLLAALAARCCVPLIAFQEKPLTGVPDAQTLQKMAARFAPTEITADLSKLPDADRRVLAKLVDASKIIDALFLRQVWAGNDAMLLDLVRDPSPLGRERLHSFLINKGPWSRLDHNLVFVPGAPAKPAAANFYPEGATKAE